MNIPYEKCRGLIKEADVLLFKTGTLLKNPVGWTIGAYTHSQYSHTGLAHWEDNELYCVEFREFKGSRKYKVDDYITEGQNIDVFRAIQTYIRPKIEFDTLVDEYYNTYIEHKFTADIANNVTNTALELLGRKYSYWTIWQMFKTYIPFIRLGKKVVKNGETDTKSFVCSTLITYAYRKNYVDPVPFLSDSLTSPGDLSRSGLFSKLFSIKD